MNAPVNPEPVSPRHTAAPAPLLSRDDPAAVRIERDDAASDFVIVCDHAGDSIPQALGTLGLSDAELAGALACDLGTTGVARQLAERLDACVILQPYSRAVIDCDRPLDADDMIPQHGEWTTIAGNERLGSADRQRRVDEIFTPFHEAIRSLLDRRQRDRRASVLLSLQSYAPSRRGEPRPWLLGLRYQHDARLAQAALPMLRRDERLVIGDNAPFAMNDDNSYTLLQHGERRGLPCLGITLRQDQIADEAGQKAWAGRLASLLRQAAATLPRH